MSDISGQGKILCKKSRNRMRTNGDSETCEKETSEPNENGNKQMWQTMFPNYFSLTEVEKSIFRETLLIARKTIEERQNIEVGNLGTIHDELLNRHDEDPNASRPATNGCRTGEIENIDVGEGADAGQDSDKSISISCKPGRSSNAKIISNESLLAEGSRENQDPARVTFTTDTNEIVKSDSKRGSEEDVSSANSNILKDDKLAFTIKWSEMIENSSPAEEIRETPSRSILENSLGQNDLEGNANVKSKENKGRKEKFLESDIPQASGRTFKAPKFKLLNENEKGLFFEVLQVAYDNVREKDSHSKSTIAYSNIMKMYSEMQGTQYFSVEDKNKKLRIKLGMTIESKDNERIRKMNEAANGRRETLSEVTGKTITLTSEDSENETVEDLVKNRLDESQTSSLRTLRSQAQSSEEETVFDTESEVNEIIDKVIPRILEDEVPKDVIQVRESVEKLEHAPQMQEELELSNMNYSSGDEFTSSEKSVKDEMESVETDLEDQKAKLSTQEKETETDSVNEVLKEMLPTEEIESIKNGERHHTEGESRASENKSMGSQTLLTENRIVKPLEQKDEYSDISLSTENSEELSSVDITETRKKFEAEQKNTENEDEESNISITSKQANKHSSVIYSEKGNSSKEEKGDEKPPTQKSNNEISVEEEKESGKYLDREKTVEENFSETTAMGITNRNVMESGENRILLKTKPILHTVDEKKHRITDKESLFVKQEDSDSSTDSEERINKTKTIKFSDENSNLSITAGESVEKYANHNIHPKTEQSTPTAEPKGILTSHKRNSADDDSETPKSHTQDVDTKPETSTKDEITAPGKEPVLEDKLTSKRIAAAENIETPIEELYEKTLATVEGKSSLVKMFGEDGPMIEKGEKGGMRDFIRSENKDHANVKKVTEMDIKRSSESFEDIRPDFLTTEVIRRVKPPKTKTRILQDLLKDRAAFVHTSTDMVVVRQNKSESLDTTYFREETIAEQEAEVEDKKKYRKKHNWQYVLGKIFSCGQKEREEADGIIENLKGESVAIEMEGTHRNPASATLDSSTLRVLQAAKRKRIVRHYMKP